MNGRVRTILRFAACATFAALIPSSCSQPPKPLLPSDYKTWEETTHVELTYPIPGHESNYRLPRVNPVGFAYKPTTSQGKNAYTYPDGTIFAKEVYHGLDEPKAGVAPFQITFAVKDTKDPRARGGWIWAVKDTASGQETVITGSFCVDCHANANENHPYGDKNPNAEFRDYVFFPPFLRDTVPVKPES